VELQQCALAVAQWQGRTFFYQMVGEAIYAAFGELGWSTFARFHG
jgi:hypothetical protein